MRRTIGGLRESGNYGKAKKRFIPVHSKLSGLC
nr:MAG TPA: hypothetical protein [Caudoviricetes sp.]